MAIGIVLKVKNYSNWVLIGLWSFVSNLDIFLFDKNTLLSKESLLITKHRLTVINPSRTALVIAIQIVGIAWAFHIKHTRIPFIRPHIRILSISLELAPTFFIKWWTLLGHHIIPIPVSGIMLHYNLWILVTKRIGLGGATGNLMQVVLAGIYHIGAVHIVLENWGAVGIRSLAWWFLGTQPSVVVW